jgi:hypothetical protein
MRLELPVSWCAGIRWRLTDVETDPVLSSQPNGGAQQPLGEIAFHLSLCRLMEIM